jgi:hypothetical protein
MGALTPAGEGLIGKTFLDDGLIGKAIGTGVTDRGVRVLRCTMEGEEECSSATEVGLWVAQCDAGSESD